MRIFSLLILCLLILALALVPQSQAAGRVYVAHYSGYHSYHSSYYRSYSPAYYYYSPPAPAPVIYAPLLARPVAGDAVREEIRKVIREELQKALTAPQVPTMPPASDSKPRPSPPPGQAAPDDK